MATIAECLQRASQLVDSESPRLDVEVLLTCVVGKDRAWLYTWPEKILSQAQQQQFDDLFYRRLRGEPVAYLTGVREFWSLPLKVNSSTLIPRPETETLIERVLSLALPNQAKVLDLGTGTGAIALALASEKPYWQIIAVDNSVEAVALAEENRNRLGIGNVSVIQSDWFANLGDQQFDLIVSNPPYIDPDDQHLQQGDVRFEPRSALVAEAKGFADIEQIIRGANAQLVGGGWLIFEHGFEQGEKARQLMENTGFSEVATGCDYSGNQRITWGQRP